MRLARLTALAILTLAVLAAPIAAEAQPTGKVYRIGWLSQGAFPAALVDRSDLCIKGFVDGLRELGYREGPNLLIEPRTAEGRPERLPELAAELVRLGVDAIVTVGNRAARAARQATASVPIVMAGSVSPVDTGLVTSLARPGGNLTGMTISFDFDMDSKRLQLFKEAVPRISRVGVIHATPATPKYVGQSFSVYFKDLVAAAQSLQVTLIPLVADGPDQLPAEVSAALALKHVDALFVDETPLNFRLSREIGEQAAKHRVPWMGGLPPALRRGGGLARVWAEHGRSVPARRCSCRPNLQGREAGRPPYRGAHHARADCQPQNGEGARADNPAGGSTAGDRGYPVSGEGKPLRSG